MRACLLRRLLRYLTVCFFFQTSLLAEQGVPLKAIMQRVGHNEPRTTMAVYTHVTESMKQEAVAALNRIVAGGQK